MTSPHMFLWVARAPSSYFSFLFLDISLVFQVSIVLSLPAHPRTAEKILIDVLVKRILPPLGSD